MSLPARYNAICGKSIAAFHFLFLISAMQKIYQIRCSCGKTHEVAETAAGSTQRCSCGVELEIPPLRQLRNCPTVERTEKKAAGKSLQEQEAGVRQRRLGLLVLTLVLAAVFGGFSVYYYVTRPYIPKIAECNLYETWQVWQYLRPGIDAPFSRQETLLLHSIDVYWRWIILLGVLSLVSLGSALAILLMPVKSN
ncbi:MAG: hypothetical protein Q4D62_16315 [Planctomycetia bacterium]|nr:hypothetical protein [Planctomycetia bacterium]